MRLKRWPIFILSFSLGSVFYFVSADVNMPPPNDGGQSGSYRCDSTGDKNCYYNQSIPDPEPDTHQAYSGSYTTTLEETLGNSSYLRVESCLTQYGWMLGNVVSCQTTVDKNVFNYAGSLPFSWSDTNEIDLGYLNDLNYLSVHIFVNNVSTNTTGTASGRRVYINNFNASPSSMNAGDPFTVNWGTDNGVNLATFLYSGPINCGATGGVPLSDSRPCTATGPGMAQIELQVYGPGGDGPIVVNEIRSISINSLCGNGVIDFGEQCDGGNLNGQSCQTQGYAGGTLSCNPLSCTLNLSNCGRNKCTGVGSSCSFTAGDLGPDQCSTPSDAVCIVATPTPTPTGSATPTPTPTGSATPTPTPTPGPTGYFCSANWVDNAVVWGGTSVYGGKMSKTSCLTYCQSSSAQACNWNTEDSCDAVFGGGLFVNSPYNNWSYAWPQASPCSATPTPTPTGSATPTPTPGPTSTVQGKMFNDLNNNGSIDGGETGVASQWIYLRDSACSALLNAQTTDSSGNYSFGNTPIGNYCVSTALTSPPFIKTTADPYSFTLTTAGITHNFGLGVFVQTLSATLTATPNSGPSPLDVALTANTSGTATGTTNYSFWWNCADTTSSVATATSVCGSLPSPGAGSCSGDNTGFKCQDVANNSYSSNVVWTNSVNVTPSGNSIIKTSGGDGAWNAGAVSSQTISSGDGYAEFSTNEIGTHKMAGLNSGGNTGQGYNEIEYAFYMQGGAGVQTLYIFESGVNSGWPQNLYNPGDVLRVAIELGNVKYYKNGSLLYEHAITPVYPYILDTSLYSQSPDATITNAKITIPANITPSHAYIFSSMAKVIVERGTAPAAQDQETITVTLPAPSVSNATVTVSNSNYCSVGIHATVSWNYSSAGSPPQSNQVAYQVQIDDDNDPLAGNPEWEQSGTTGTSAVTTPCNLANPVTSPQTNCRMNWNTLYRAWVRVQNGYGEWSPWTQMSTYCNGSSCGPATNWTTPAHQLPSPDFSITPPNPELGIPVIFDDILPTFDGSATFGSWSWNFGDGSIVRSTDPTIPLDVAGTTHTYVANGNYTVKLAVEDELGISCANSSLISIQKTIPRWREIAPR